MTRMRRKLVGTAAFAVAVLALPATALAAGPGGGGGSGGGGGTGETTTNNLSVPTVFVPGAGAFPVTCGLDGPIAPTGQPRSGYPLDPAAYYYVQGVNAWQAQCQVAAAGTVSANAAWGDNLTGSASLTARHPIRVEVALNDDATNPMQGYTVLKLEPNALDRTSAYGTIASGSPETGFSASPETFSNPLVYDANATLSIVNDATSAVVHSGVAGAEINATGKVVYGYNFTAPTAGTYTITLRTPDVTISKADAGTSTANSVSLTITVGGNSGGGRGGGVGRGGGGSGGGGVGLSGGSVPGRGIGVGRR